MKNMFKKMILAVMTTALVFAAFPVTSAFAQGENPAPTGEVSNEKLEKAWARQLKIYERLGNGFDDLDGQIEKIQERIDKAASNGRDVTALQAALDAFEAASKTTQPIYDSIESIVNSHAGFDADGKVTDAEQAKSTVQEMGAKLKEVKSSMDGTGKALREALKAFRKVKK
jgi:DNA repair exonuclease SbcCD ATPase subunit